MNLQDVLRLRDDVLAEQVAADIMADEPQVIRCEWMRDQLDSILDWTVLCGSTGELCPRLYCVKQCRNQVFKDMGSGNNWDIYQRIYELVHGVLYSSDRQRIEEGQYQGMWVQLAAAQCRNEVAQIMRDESVSESFTYEPDQPVTFIACPQHNHFARSA